MHAARQLCLLVSWCNDFAKSPAFRVDFEAGALAAIEDVTRLLALHFPAGADNPDELPDRPVIVV